MYWRMRDTHSVVVGATIQDTLRNANPDKYYFFFKQTDHAECITLTELQTGYVTMTLKRQGSREEILLEGCKLWDLVQNTNSRGGVSYNDGSNCPTFMGGYVDLGRVNLKGGDEIVVAVTFGAWGTLTGGAPKFSHGFVKTHDLDLPIKKYISYRNSQTISFQNVLELFSSGASHAGEAGNTLYVSTQTQGQLAVLDTVAWACELFTGKFESDDATLYWFMVYVDPTGNGEDITVRTEANTDLFAVCYA